MEITQFLALLQGVKPTGEKSWSARCPAHDDKNPSLSVTEKSDRVLIHCHATCTPDAVCSALGIKASDLFFKPNSTHSTTPTPRAKSGFDWQRCLDAFTSDTAASLAKWRGVSAEFFNWLNAQKQLGVHDGKPAFAVRDESGAVVSCHYPAGDGKWKYFPSGQGTHPLTFGDVAKSGFVLAFESTWDCLATMEKLGWHPSEIPDTAFFCTRGVGNAKLIRDRVSPDAVVFGFGQNDDPGRKWLAELASNAGCRVLDVATPAPHKDTNDWTRAGASESEIRAAMKAAKPVQAQPPRVESTGSDFATITAAVRGQIVSILTDDDLTQAQQRNAIAGLAVTAVCRVGSLYFHAERRDFESAMFFNRIEKRLERIRGDAFTAWLSDWLRLNRADSFFKYAIAAVETAALSGSQTTGILPETFWARRPGAFYLSNGDGQAVKITADKVELADNGIDSVLFSAGNTLAAWTITEPQDPFATCSLFSGANCAAKHGPDLIRLWTISLPTCPPSKPPICPAGPIGSGKTALAKGIAGIYGLQFVANKAEDNGENSFWASLDAGGLFTLDNCDTRNPWLADAVAAAATDGCSQRRRLYTDADRVTLRPRAWLCLTAANPTFASDAGLADRLLVVRMNRRTDETSDAALWAEIAQHRDAALSFIAHTLATALADTGPVPAGLNQRHPDFAAFAVRIGRAIGREAEAVAALRSAELDKSAFCIENDSIGAALLTALQSAGPFTGTAKELRERMIEAEPDLADKLSARRLGKRLSMLWPHLEKILATAEQQTGRGRVVTYKLSARQSDEFGECQTAFPIKSPYTHTRDTLPEKAL